MIVTIVNDNGTIKAKQVNEKTNAKMGARHINYESLLPIFEITNLSELTLKVGETWFGDTSDKTINLLCKI